MDQQQTRAQIQKLRAILYALAEIKPFLAEDMHAEKDAPFDYSQVSAALRHLTAHLAVKKAALEASLGSLQRVPGGSGEFRIEGEGNGAFLAEHRPGRGKPIRCPKLVYDRLAELFAKSAEPLTFTQIDHQMVQFFPASVPGNHQIRVCIRFWISHDPPLIERFRARYRALAPARFVDGARWAWDALARQK